MPCITPTYTPDNPDDEPVFTPDDGVEADFDADDPSWHMVEEDDSQCIGEGVTVQLPNTPTGLAVTNPTVDSLDVSWDASIGSSSYEVDRALASGGPWTNVFAGAGTSFTDTPLDDGVEYFYRVRGVNALGESDWSAPVSGTTVAIILPDVPTGLAVANPTASTLDISWNAALNADSYEVDRALTALGPWTNVYADVALSFTDTGLSSSTEYFYRVRAVNVFGTSAWSAVVSETTASAISLTRASLGRLAAYSMAPIAGVEDTFEPTDFEIPPNCSLGFDINGFFIRSLSNNIFQRVSAHIATGDRADSFIIVLTGTIGGAAQCGAGSRSDNGAYPNNTGIYGDVPINGAFSTRVIEVVSGAQLQVDSDAANLSSPQRVSLWTKGTTAKTYAFGPGFENVINGMTLAAAGGVGPTYNRGSAGFSYYKGIWIMTDAILTVNGPVGNWRADIVDSGGVVLATATSVAGVASVDMFAARVVFPNAVKIEIRDTGTSALIVDSTPADRIWGGDVWTYTA